MVNSFRLLPVEMKRRRVHLSGVTIDKAIAVGINVFAKSRMERNNFFDGACSDALLKHGVVVSRVSYSARRVKRGNRVLSMRGNKNATRKVLLND